MSLMPTRALMSFACGDVVPSCTLTFYADAHADILVLVAAHARADHNLPDIPAELLDAARRYIHTVPAAPLG